MLLSLMNFFLHQNDTELEIIISKYDADIVDFDYFL